MRGALQTGAKNFLVILMVVALVWWAPAGVLSPGIGVAAAQDDGPPPIPAAYYGNVTVNGEPAPADTIIEAEVNGEVKGSITIKTDGKFGAPDALDEKLTVEGEHGDSGVAVRFFVNNDDIVRTEANITDPDSVTWESADVQNVDLEADAESSTPTGDDGSGDGETTEEEPTDGEDSTGQGGGGGGGQAGGGETTEDEPEPVVAETTEEIEEILPETAELPEDVNVTSAEKNTITDSAGTNESEVTFTDETVTQSIKIQEDVSGSAAVVEMEGVPEDTGDPPGDPVVLNQIVMPDGASGAPGIIVKSVPIEWVEETNAEPEDLAIARFVEEGGEWEPLETDVVEVTDEEVRLEAETPGFSYFAVVALVEPVPALDAPTEVEVGEEATFDATESTDEWVEVVDYNWTVAGEPVEGEETLTYSFDSPGEVTVEVTVKNEAGKTNVTSTTVQVVGQEATVTVIEAEETLEEPTPTETSTESPGFTMGLSIIALIGAALLALRRKD